MRPDSKFTDEQLLQWARGIVEREQGEQTYGTVTISLEAGRIVRVQTMRNEMPGTGPQRDLSPGTPPA